MTSTDAAAFPFVPTGDSPLIIERTDGNHLYPRDGEPILDAGGGAIVTNIGHGRREIAETAAQALSTVDYVLPLFATDARIRLRNRLVDNWLPPELTRIGLMSGGSESVDSAIRLARQHHVAAGRDQKWKIIGRQPSYHGVTLATLAAGGHDGRRAGFDPLLLPFPKVPWNDPQAVETTILAEGPETVSAFIGEPVIGASGGALTPDEDYWPRVAEICARHEVLLIIDEVMTGFGRTGLPFGIQHWGVTPDILVGGKGLGGGYTPIGGLYATEEVVGPIAEADGKVMFFTFTAQDQACAIADRVLSILEEEDLVARAARMGAVLRDRLDDLSDHPLVSDVRGLGLLQGIGLVKDKSSGEPFSDNGAFAASVVTECLKRNLWVYPAGGAAPVGDALLIGPPYTVTHDEIDLIVRTVREAIDAAAAA